MKVNGIRIDREWLKARMRERNAVFAKIDEAFRKQDKIHARVDKAAQIGFFVCLVVGVFGTVMSLLQVGNPIWGMALLLGYLAAAMIGIPWVMWFSSRYIGFMKRRGSSR